MRKACAIIAAFALCITCCLTVGAETNLATTALGFYQQEVPDAQSGPHYVRCGKQSKQVVPSDYHMGKPGYYGTRFTVRSDNIPTDKDYVQLTLVLRMSAANSIAEDYRSDFYQNAYSVDFNQFNAESFPATAAKLIKPLKAEQHVTSAMAQYNMMLSKEQLISMSRPSGAGTSYTLITLFQINQNFMISQLQETSGIGVVMLTSVQWSETTDLVPMDEQTVRALTQLEGTVEDGFNKVTIEQQKTNEKLDSIDQSIKDQDQNEWDFGSDKVGNPSEGTGMFGDVSIGIGEDDIKDNPVYTLGDTIGSLFDISQTSSTMTIPPGEVFGHKLWDETTVDFAQYESGEYGEYFGIFHTLLKVFAWVAFAVFTFKRLNMVIGVVTGENSWSSLWETASDDTTTSLFHQDDDEVSLFHKDEYKTRYKQDGRR